MVDWQSFLGSMLAEQPPEPHDYWERLLRVQEERDPYGEWLTGIMDFRRLSESQDAKMDRGETVCAAAAETVYQRRFARRRN